MTSKMSPSKETLLNSYIDVKGWSEEDVQKAAEWLAENTGMEVAEGKNIEVLNDLGYHYLIADEQGNTVWVGGKAEVKHRTRLADLSFMYADNCEERLVTNTLESLKKAKQELAFAKDCLEASQEAVEEAQKAYTDAYKAFKEEADGLLREEEETSEMPFGEGSEESCSSFLVKYSPVDNYYHTERSLSVGDVYSVIKTVVGDNVSYIIIDDYGTKIHFPSMYEFCQRFQRVE